METEQRSWTKKSGWRTASGPGLSGAAGLVLCFGATGILEDDGFIEGLRALYPGAHFLGCSTAGEVSGTRILDDSVVLTAAAFTHTEIRGTETSLRHPGDSFGAGARLAGRLLSDDLIHVLALSDGLAVNGSDLVKGLRSGLPAPVTITGGLAGDGRRFAKTLVFFNEGPATGRIAAVGFYGTRLRVGWGSLGGWDPFGPERLITRSSGNVLYDMDGRPALELYKRYLGDYAGGLPAAGLLFPLSLRTREGAKGVVRTILAVNEETMSMTFAGDVPEGAYARLMKANVDRLIDGAMGAARTSLQGLGHRPPELTLLISCVGRRLVLKQRSEEEVEGVCEVLGGTGAVTGFYSYGEIGAFAPEDPCELHNQTMTVTAFTEI